MKRKNLTGLVLGLFLISGAGIAQANLFGINSDFDVTADMTGKVNGKNLNALAGGWDVFDALPGFWEAGDNTAGIEIQNQTVTEAHSGEYYVELDSHGGSAGNNSYMYKDIFLHEGNYELSFWYHGRTSTAEDNGIYGFFDNGSGMTRVGSVAGVASGWSEIVWTFSIQETRNYMVGFGAEGSDNTYGGFVDTASLVAAPVPEPATMLLFGTGLVGLTGLRFRRKK